MIDRSGRNLRPIASLLISTAAQITGFSVALLLAPLLESRCEACSIAAVVSLHGLTAFAIARFLSASIPWQIFNIALPFLLVFTPYFGSFSSKIALAMLLVCISLYLPTFWTRVPFYPTSEDLYQKVLDELPKEKLRFADLGCGFGSLLFFLARRRPESLFCGFELSPLAYSFAKLRSLMYRNVEIRGENFWKREWREFDVIYAFLSPEPMPLLEDKVRREGGKKLVLVNSFPLPTPCERVVEGGQNLYVYKFT